MEMFVEPCVLKIQMRKKKEKKHKSRSTLNIKLGENTNEIKEP